jgi:hypothetical protein
MRKWSTLALFLVGCGGGGESTPPPEVDAPQTSMGWTELVGRSWSVPPGSADTYKCKRVAITEDMWITGFRAIAPPGTHHTVVTVSNNGQQLGEYDCQVGSLDLQMLYASGVGTQELKFPDGVAMKIRAGQFINLNLHLFNASDSPLTGTSGIEVERITADKVVHEADMTFSGTMNINIPSDGQPHTVEGGCTVSSPRTIFTVWPHMHQAATHQSFEITQGATVTKLLDNKPYSFEEQVNYQITPMQLSTGDRIKTTCTFVNNTGSTITWGDSSNQEMCFTGMYKYPAGGNLFSCATN